ncbi:MAG: DUF3108 domain-containing protein [candidate division WOR-3 bacterium]
MLCLFLFISFPFTAEVLNYDVYLGIWRVGELRLSLKEGFFTGETVYFLSSVLKSNFPFRIDDSLFTVSRRNDFTTLYSYKKVEEGNYQKELTYQFNGDRIEYSDGTIFPARESPKDLLTLWYFFRSSCSDTNRETFAHFDKKDYRVKINPKECRYISNKFGSFLVRRLQPETFPKSILGDIYISEDSLRLPLVIKTRLLLGMVKAILKKRSENG